MSTLKLRTVCVVLCLALLAAEASSKPTSKNSRSKGKKGGTGGSSAFVSSSASSTGTSKTASSSTSGSKKTGPSRTHSMQTTERGISSSASATGTGSVSASASAVSGQTAYRGKPKRKTRRGSSQETQVTLADCTGMAAYKCCRYTSSFHRSDDGVFCGCSRRAGSGQLCHYKVIGKAPVVVKDIYGTNAGDLCQCSGSSSRTSTKATA